jgi:hypothetical protein
MTGPTWIGLKWPRIFLLVCLLTYRRSQYLGLYVMVIGGEQ